jgi:hypothetical protein
MAFLWYWWHLVFHFCVQTHLSLFQFCRSWSRRSQRDLLAQERLRWY